MRPVYALLSRPLHGGWTFVHDVDAVKARREGEALKALMDPDTLSMLTENCPRERIRTSINLVYRRDSHAGPSCMLMCCLDRDTHTLLCTAEGERMAGVLQLVYSSPARHMNIEGPALFYCTVDHDYGYDIVPMERSDLDRMAKLGYFEVGAGPSLCVKSTTDMVCEACGILCDMRCSRCRHAYYCDRDCQVAHWPAHKATCHV